MIVTPLKIQGKKTRMLPSISRVSNYILEMHPEIDTWVEPFLGSGIVAFNAPTQQIKRVIVNDINPHIIQFYECINAGTLTGNIVRKAFEEYADNLYTRGEDYYNEVRTRFNDDFNTLDFLFLTRTGFNGVMRFNSKGKWNVPFCKVNNRLTPGVIDDLVKSVDELFELFKTREYIFFNKSFEDVIKDAPETSFFYCDPPYYGLYTQYYKGWGKEHEIELNRLLHGKRFVYSTWVNDGHRSNPMIDELWCEYTLIEEPHRYYVAGSASGRPKMAEGLIYPCDDIPNDEQRLF